MNQSQCYKKEVEEARINTIQKVALPIDTIHVIVQNGQDYYYSLSFH